eukprot:scaffold40265_cov39-Tisochrysis_lutea.AAC.1
MACQGQHAQLAHSLLSPSQARLPRSPSRPNCGAPSSYSSRLSPIPIYAVYVYGLRLGFMISGGGSFQRPARAFQSLTSSRIPSSYVLCLPAYLLPPT